MPKLMQGANNVKTSTYEQKHSVYQKLKERILCFDLAPGEMLSENTLSAQLSVTRSVVREAITRLAEEGYIVVYPQRGSSVSLLDPGRVRQSVSAHIILETAILDEMCRKGLVEKQLEALGHRVTVLKETAVGDDILRFLENEYALHYQLSAYCGKELSFELFRSMDCDLLRVKYLLYDTYNYKVDMSSLTGRENSVVECRLILDNLRRRDAEAAALICANHYNNISWNTDTLQRIYPQFFAGTEQT